MKILTLFDLIRAIITEHTTKHAKYNIQQLAAPIHLKFPLNKAAAYYVVHRFKSINTSQ
jgi:hypothetical protein